MNKTDENLRRRNVPAVVIENDLPDGDAKSEDLIEHNDKAVSSRALKSLNYIENTIWIVGSMFIFYYTDFAKELLYNVNVERAWLYCGLILISVTTLLGAFCVIWLYCIQKIPHSDWDQHYPSLVPVATSCFSLGTICINIALWPVWWIFTPLVLFTIFMGFITVISLLPAF